MSDRRAIDHLFDARPHDDDGIEVDLAPHEPAGDVGPVAAGDDRVKPLPRGVRDRDEDDVGPRLVEHAIDLDEAAENRDPLHPAATETRVVVDEAHHLVARSLPQFAEQAPPAAPRPDDQRAPTQIAVPDRPERVEQCPLAEARCADQGDAEERVDHVDARREVAEGAEAEPDDPDRDRLGHDHRGRGR